MVLRGLPRRSSTQAPGLIQPCLRTAMPRDIAVDLDDGSVIRGTATGIRIRLSAWGRAAAVVGAAVARE